MNLLYSGDRRIEDGLIISLISVMDHVSEPLDVTVMTVSLDMDGVSLEPVSDEVIAYLDRMLRKKSPESSVKLADMSREFSSFLPLANMDTRFTPCCMLRLYADLIPGIPDRILYLDNDTIVRDSIDTFYHQDADGCEIAGVLDYYGRWFFRRKPFRFDYLNSGVLLLDMRRIRETQLFERCRKMCRERKIFMPDQSALNKLASGKKICPGRYNEQRKLREDTAIQHFTTNFRFFPFFRKVTVKPWEIEKMHKTLHLHEYDGILQRYSDAVKEIRE